MRSYPQLFDDIIPRTFEAFREGMMNPTNQFYEFIKDGETIGLAAATQVRPRLDCNIHIVMFDRRLRGREDIMLTALRDFTARAKLRRISAVLPEDNRTAIKLALRLGFAHEGTMRKAHLRDGIYRDYLIFGILAEELFDLNRYSGEPEATGGDGADLRGDVRPEPDVLQEPHLHSEDEVFHGEQDGHGVVCQ
jgi:RimJ/RimL family protein N-acetyltransferase